MPPNAKSKSTTKRRATTKAGPAAAAPVVPPFRFSDAARCMLDEVAELLLAALERGAPPTRAAFVYRVEKRDSAIDGELTGVLASTRVEADKVAALKARLWKCRLRFVREQRQGTK